MLCITLNLEKILKSSELPVTSRNRNLAQRSVFPKRLSANTKMPTFDVLIRIAAYFGVTTDYLLGVTGGKTIDVSELSDSQIDTLHRIITEFKKVGKE